MGKETTDSLLCPGCSAPVSPRTKDARGFVRCRCGKSFVPGNAATEAIELEEVEGPTVGNGLEPSEEYGLAGDEPREPRDKQIARQRSTTPRSFAADVAAQYPSRRAKPAEAAVGAVEETASLLKNLYVPLALLAIGYGLRVGQLLFARGAHGNQWWGSAAAPPGVGKSLLLALFEMIIASAITAAGAFVAAVVLGTDVGSLGKAAFKLAAAAVFATGVACWITFFDQGAFSVGGLILALHAMVIIYWITLGYLFSLELQELILTVAAITLAHSLGIAGLWHG